MMDAENLGARSGLLRERGDSGHAVAELARWRGLFEKLREGFVVAELVRGSDGRVVDWRYIEVNEAWSRLVGLPSRAAVGRTVRDIFPAVEDAWIEQMATVCATRRPTSFTLPLGPRRWYEGSAFPLEGDRFAVLFLDVAGRAEADRRQRALLALSDRLRDAVDTAEIAAAAAEAIADALGANRAGYGTLTSNGEVALVERDWSAPGLASIAGPHRMRNYGAYIDNLHRGEAVVVRDVAVDGLTAAASFAAIDIGAMINMPIIENGRLAALLYVGQPEPHDWTDEEIEFVRDIAERTRSASERRRAEHDLRTLNATLETMVAQRTRERDQIWKASTDLLCIASLEGYLLSLNPAWLEVLGWTEQEMKAVPFLDFVHPDDREATLEAAGGLLRGEPQLTFENRYRRKDGTYRWFSWNAVPRDGVIYSTVRDVTAIKEQAEALARTEEALRQSQKMEAVGQLTGGLAHDFNNMLAGITGSLELMQTRLLQGRYADLERYVGAAQGAAKRAAALTHRLLAFSRRQTLDPKPTDANRLIAGMEDLVRRSVGPSVEIEVVAAGGLWSTLVDPSQLENALLNLCINARDAMPAGGRIVIETANRWLDARAARERELEPGQFISLCVSDNGTGMAPETIAKAFDPFFTTKPIGEGTGLGLSMIYGFVRQSGGQVRIYSEIGQGTNVCLYLPRHFGDAETERDGAERSVAARARAGETVLVVDDEPTVRMLVTEVLEDLGYAAIEAADGPSGLKVLRSDVRIDLLVTDVGLPGGLNGRQVADAARVQRPELKVLFITGFAENAALNHGHLAPGMQVLTKPFAMDALATRIRAMIEGP